MQLVQDLEATQAELEALEAPEQLRWANDHFGSGFAVTTSFGTQSAVLLHLLVAVAPDVPVYWIDTGYLFPETYQYAADLTQRLKLNLKVVQPELSPARMEALLGRLWESENPDDLVTYHRLRKVEPLDQALDAAEVSCWASGVRAGQTDNRAAMRPLERLRGRWSLRPLLRWTRRDVYYYMEKHELPHIPCSSRATAPWVTGTPVHLTMVWVGLAALAVAIRSVDCICRNLWWKAPGFERCGVGC